MCIGKQIFIHTYIIMIYTICTIYPHGLTHISFYKLTVYHYQLSATNLLFFLSIPWGKRLSFMALTREHVDKLV